MRPCPVCEAPVTGWMCEVCGKQVGPSPGAANLTVPLEGLESTQLPPDGVALPIETTPGLEPTATSPVPEVSAEPVPDWEATRCGVSPDVGAGGLDDLDPGRAVPEGLRVAAPAVATCRYCRNVQASGLFCDRCGMRLPWVAPAAVSTAVESTDRRVCKRCGERSPPTMERCGACGAVLESEL